MKTKGRKAKESVNRRSVTKAKPSTEWQTRRDYAVGVLIGLLLVGSLFLVTG
jgi:hypothetical protein